MVVLPSFRARPIFWTGSLVSCIPNLPMSQSSLRVFYFICTKLISLGSRFNHFHPEKLESAQSRYEKELKRVVGVLDRALKGRDWLVGAKCTYADLAFVMWNVNIEYVLKDRPDGWNIADYPNFKRWHEAILARDSLKKVLSVLQDKEVKSEGRV